MKKLRLLVIATVFLVMPLFVRAHLAEGQDIHHGSYIVDVGYDPKIPIEGESTTFAFNLAQAESGKAVLPTDVWVRIMKGESLVFSGTFKPQPANVTLSYTFPSAGDYDVRVQFNGVHDGPISETIPIVVAAKNVPQVTAPPHKNFDGALAFFTVVAAFVIGFSTRRDHVC